MPHLTRLLSDHTHPVLAVLTQIAWVLQIALIIHVYKTGRPYWWIWVLFGAPMIGGLAYVGIELVPELRSPRGFFYSLKPRRWRIADLRRTLEDTETVQNRFALADELEAAGELGEAHEVASECLRGVFKDDPHTMAEVAHYKVALKRYDEACDILERIDTARDRMLDVRVTALKGDALLGLKRYAEAEEAYESLGGRYVGEAPRAGLALIYEQTGRADQATQIWKDIRTKFRRSNPAWRKTERRWYKLATAKLKERG